MGCIRWFDIRFPGSLLLTCLRQAWIPAFAGMTEGAGMKKEVEG